MPSLHIGKQFSSLLPGCCPANVAAVIFNKDGKALKLISTSPDVWELATYTEVTHADFCIPLAEHSERSMYYYVDMDTDTFTLATSEEYPYMVEYWYKASAGYGYYDDYDRTADTLLGESEFFWNATALQVVPCPVNQSLLTELIQRKAVIQMAYDHANETIYAMVWLEKAGQLVDDTQYANITWLESDGTVLASATLSTYVTDMDGVFYTSIPLIDLTGDRISACLVEIVDADSNSWKSMNTVVAYD
jgi:hypothetical protein